MLLPRCFPFHQCTFSNYFFLEFLLISPDTRSRYFYPLFLPTHVTLVLLDLHCADTSLSFSIDKKVDFNVSMSLVYDNHSVMNLSILRLMDSRERQITD